MHNDSKYSIKLPIQCIHGNILTIEHKIISNKPALYDSDRFPLTEKSERSRAHFVQPVGVCKQVYFFYFSRNRFFRTRKIIVLNIATVKITIKLYGA